MCIQSRNHKSIQFSFSARRRWIRGRRVGRDREWNSNSLVAFGSTKMGKETHTHTHQRKLTRTNGKRQIYNDQWFTASAMWYSIKIEIGRKPKRTPARVFMNSHNNKPNGWGGGGGWRFARAGFPMTTANKPKLLYTIKIVSSHIPEDGRKRTRMGTKNASKTHSF